MKASVLLPAALLLMACQNAVNPAFYTEGVSLELAQHRKATIQDLTYNLRFDIPALPDEDIQGSDTIGFTLQEAEEVVLDFRETSDKIHQVIINGTEVPLQVEREHLILPKEYLQKGANQVFIQFTAGDQSLNRNQDYLYTLFVPDRARTAFPCMEQPNLKGKFTLTLVVPADWEAVSNTYCQDSVHIGAKKEIHFAKTEPLSTYLFAFAAGKFQHQTYSDGKRTIGAYYRETDPKRVAQLPEIFRQVAYALQWQEDFTGMPYPFAKYDLVILPGFQFGGMEHTGATFYNDNTLFLNDHPTMDEQLSRAQLIAHETTHMWFGDCVTMDWFNDVWTKEVFANYFAAAITAPLFPLVNHDLNWMKTYAAASLAEDRTEGGTAIRQDLDNMTNAGLIYNQIIYNKAPVMLRKLVELMGPEAFQRGIQKYVKQYAYSNATWENLVEILSGETDQDLRTFSDVWVNQKGMPHINVDLQDGQLVVSQQDPYGRGLLWPQTFGVRLQDASQGDTLLTVTLNSQDAQVKYPVPEGFEQAQIHPNADGRGYGLITMSDSQLQGLLTCWQKTDNATEKYAALSLLHENYLAKHIAQDQWLQALVTALPQENDALTASTLISYLREPLLDAFAPTSIRAALEQALWTLSGNHPLYSVRVQLLRLLSSIAVTEPVVDHLYSLWETQSNELLGLTDYMSLSYELAIRLPEKSANILSTQRARIENPDRLRQFDFVSRAATSDTLALDTLFQSLIQNPAARRIEPWTRQVLSLLNHPLREQYSVKYILPGLEALADVQRTGDIFFPGHWCTALLGNHRSPEAYQAVLTFLSNHPDYLALRRNKILLGAYPLFRNNNDKTIN